MSYNQPKLPSYARWNPNGISFPNETAINFILKDIFIDRNNTIYVTDTRSKQIYIWRTDGTTIMLDSGFIPWTIFVTIEGDIYVFDLHATEVKKWSQNTTKWTVIMNTQIPCYALFVDITNYLYCSLTDRHQVVKQSLDVDANVSITVAGTDTYGKGPNMLYSPHGIFIDTNFDLYVADYQNSRVQLFKFGQQNGITVMGMNSILGNINFFPTAVFLDADGYLFVIDRANSLIIGSNRNGFYCIIGCSGRGSGASYQLSYSNIGAATFDSYGNIFVIYFGIIRNQKFILMTNASGK